MANYRKKPVIVSAEQWFMVGGPSELHVGTTHTGQWVLVELGDWILQEPDGKGFYPCKPDIFATTYEPAP